MNELPDFAADLPIGKTMLKRSEQYRDRWTSHGAKNGLRSISDKLSVRQLKSFELFAEYDDRFLERISPDISVATWEEGSTLFEQGSYIDLAFFVVEGFIDVFVEGVEGTASQAIPIFDLSRTMEGGSLEELYSGSQTIMTTALKPPSAAPTKENSITFLSAMDFDLPTGATARLGSGEVVGEIGALSGWPQSVTARTASECKVIQIRIPALRLMKRKSVGLSKRLDDLYRERSLVSQLKSTPLLRDCPDHFFERLKGSVELVSCQPGEEIVRQGESADALYLVRSGFVKLTQGFFEGEIVATYLSKGMTFGEVELLLDGIRAWEITATSVEHAELVKLPRKLVDYLVVADGKIEERLWRTATDRIREAGFSRRNIQHSEFTQVALDTGLVQGSSILAIDLGACTRCDDCVRACAETHGGRPRFVREGNKYKNLLIAKSCYHCRDPVCLVGCPTGAIHRAGIDEVIEIDDHICIGCSTCANNCPYDAIVMHETGEVWPADMVPTGLRGQPRQVASKCDLCHDSSEGPACVNNCPQGCAYRVGSIEEFESLIGSKE